MNYQIPMSFVLVMAALAGFVPPAFADPPPAPTVNWPTAGMVLGSNRLDMTWNGFSNDAYEVHIGSFNAPTSANGWNSGQIFGAQSVFAVTTPAIAPQQTYYLFVRLHNADGWGDWSPPNLFFYIAGEWLADPYFVASPTGAQRDHSIAFNPDRNEYLVGYLDIQSAAPRWYINAWRLNSNGVRLGSEIQSTGGVDGAGATVAAYNSVNHEYLLAGRDFHAHLFGQRINANDGSLPAAAGVIHDTSSTLEYSLAYGAGSNVYLEVWRDDGGGACSAILGQLVSGVNGALVGGVITIANNGNCVGGPKIAYNATANEFLVVYQQVPPSNQQDLYCRRVRASDGAVLGASPTPVAVTSSTEWQAGVAWDNNLNRYLVAYEKYDPDINVWGQFIAADASLIGSRFPISEPAYKGGAVSCAWNATAKDYLVAWMDCCSNGNFARRVSQSGTALGEVFKTSGTLEGIGNFGPLVAANAVNNDYMFCWQYSHTDVYVRHYKGYPPPAADVAPPSSVTGMTVQRFASSVQLNWTNPATADFMGTTVRFNTTGYPSGPTDGTFVVDKGNAPSTADIHRHTGLTRGTYYYALFAHDEVFNYAAPALITVVILPGDFDNDGDIDQTDFAHLQNCLKGDAIPYVASCEDADLDTDGDVDGSDFNVFLPCLGGADNPPGC